MANERERKWSRRSRRSRAVRSRGLVGPAPGPFAAGSPRRRRRSRAITASSSHRPAGLAVPPCSPNASDTSESRSAVSDGPPKVGASLVLLTASWASTICGIQGTIASSGALPSAAVFSAVAARLGECDRHGRQREQEDRRVVLGVDRDDGAADVYEPPAPRATVEQLEDRRQRSEQREVSEHEAARDVRIGDKERRDRHRQRREQRHRNAQPLAEHHVEQRGTSARPGSRPASAAKPRDAAPAASAADRTAAACSPSPRAGAGTCGQSAPSRPAMNSRHRSRASRRCRRTAARSQTARCRQAPRGDRRGSRRTGESRHASARRGRSAVAMAEDPPAGVITISTVTRAPCFGLAGWISVQARELAGPGSALGLAARGGSRGTGRGRRIRRAPKAPRSL